MKRRRCSNNFKLSAVLFGAALICLCLLSAKFTLVLLAIALAAAGIWLLKR